MPITSLPATLAQAREQARLLRAELASAGEAISHSQALERVARKLGYRDWNTAAARLSNAPEPLQVGDRVAGRYLKQPFEGRIIAVSEQNGGASFEGTVHFDQPVDVVTFESFSAFRQRVTATVGPDGVSARKTSDGAPHMVIARL